MRTWQLAEAKNRFSEVVERAIHEGPQRVQRRGAAVAVLLATKDFERLTGKKKTFKSHLLNGPRFPALDLRRDASPMRDVKL